MRRRSILSFCLFVLMSGVVLAQDAGESTRPRAGEAPGVDPEGSDSLRWLADRAYDRAADALAKELAQKPDDRTRLLLGLAQIRGGREQQGLATLEPLARDKASPWQLRAQFLMAEAHVQRKDFASAAGIYAGALEYLLSTDRKAELAQVYISLGKSALDPPEPGAVPNPTRAAGLFALALEFPLKPPAREALLRARAEALGKAEAHADAATAWGQLLTEYPKSDGAAAAALQQAREIQLAGNALEARRLLGAMLSQFPNSPLAGDAQLALAHTFGLPAPSSDRDLERGIAALRRFAESYPQHEKVADALLEIGESYAEADRTEDAVAALRQLIERFGAKPELEALAQARVRLGQLLASQLRNTEAIEVFATYLKEHPSHRRWSEVQGLLVDAQAAETMHTIALARPQLVVDATTQAAALSSAKTAAERFMTEHPVDARNPAVLLELGNAYASSNGTAEAMDAWRRLASKYPTTPEASSGLFEMGMLLAKGGDYQKAIEALAKVTGDSAYLAQEQIRLMQAPKLTVSTERVFRASEKAKLHLEIRNVPRVTLKAYRLNLETYFRSTHGTDGIESLDIALIDPDSTWVEEVPEYHALEPRKLDLPLPFGEPGCWLIQVESEADTATSMVLITNLDLLVRKVGRDALVYASDPTTGRAVAGASVLLSSPEKILAEGKTGADGVLLQKLDEKDAGADLRVFASMGAHVAATGIAGSYAADVAEKVESRAILFTDRPLYKPGDPVGIKAFVRVSDNGALKASAGRPMTLDVLAPSGQLMLTRAVSLSQWGSVQTDLVLPQQAATGSYRIRLHDKELSFEDGFEVEHYQLPKILLSIEPKSATVARGTPVEGLIRARYAYGEPLAGAQIHYGLRGEPQLEASTDAQGEVRFQFPTTELGEDQAVVIVADLPEEAVRAASSASVQVAPSQFELSVSTSSEVYLVGERFEVSIHAADWQGKPFSPQIRLELIHKTSTPDGTPVEVIAKEGSVTLDAEGTGRLGIDAAKGGSYVIRVKAIDALGNPVTAERELEISGADDDRKLHLLAETTSLQVGQKLDLRLHSRLEGPAPALVTFEGDGILGYRLETVRPGDGTLAVEAKGDYAPNFAVQVSAMSGGKLHEARSEFTVRQGLTIEIHPTTDTARPGTEVEAEIRTLDHLGRPVAAEVALAVIDEAVLALHDDTHDSMASIFYGGSRTLSGAGSCSCTFAYQAATKAISREVLDEISKAKEADDRAARLELAASNAAAMPPAQAASREMELNAPVAEMADAEGGAVRGMVSGILGGMAKEEAPAPPPPPPPLVRKRFAETAYWSATVVTDSEGRARVRFRMPDSTTSWRWVARGADTAMLVGQAQAASRTKLDVVAEIQEPLAFVEGDKASVRGTVHNLGSESLDLTTRFAWQLEGQTGMKTDEMKLDPGARQSDELDVAAPAPGTLTLTWSAGTDVVERSVPVLPWGVEEIDQAVGIANAERSVSVELPAAASQRRAMQIRLGVRWDRVLQDLWRGVNLLRDSEIAAQSNAAYETILATTVLLEEERRGHGKEAAEIRTALGAALSELISGQNADGGWAYAGRGASDPLVTAEALVALAGAGATGFEETVRQPRTAAEGRLWQWFREAQEDQLELKATLLWALSETTSVDFAYLNRLYRSRNTLSAISLARLTSAMVRAGRPEIAVELADLLASKRAAEPALPYSSENALSDGLDPVVTAAFVLRALALAKPAASATGHDATVAGLRDWLLARRWDGGYQMRRRDAWTALAIAAAGTGSEETTGRFRLDISVNGTALPAVEVGPGNDEPGAIAVPATLLKPGKNEVRFSLNGTGRFSYAVRLSGWNPTPRERGQTWNIQRTYGPAPLVRGGHVIPRGFDVVDGNYQSIENRVDNLESGAFLEASVRVWRKGNETPNALRSSHLVLEEPIPAGCSVDPDSVTGDFLAFEELPGRLVFVLPRDRWSYELKFRLLGRFAGVYGVLPARISAPDESGRTELGAARKLTVLATGQKSRDPVRLTPDELYNLGIWNFDHGNFEDARTTLDKLLQSTRLKDEPARRTVRMLFQIALRTGQTREMIRHFETTKERWPDTVLTLDEILRVGQAYRDSGEPERAYSVFRAAAEGSFLKDSQVSGTLEKEGELDASIEVLETLLRDYPPHPTTDAAAYGLGQLLVQIAQGGGPDAKGSKLAVPQEAYRRASDVLHQFLIEHPESPIADEVSFAWLGAMLEFEDYLSAVTFARRLQSRYPQSVYLPSYEYAEGYALFELRRGQDALGILSRVAQGTYKLRDGTQGPSPNRALSLFLSGQIHQAQGDFPGALGLYEQVQDQFTEAKELRDYFLRHSLTMPEVTDVVPGAPGKVELEVANLTELRVLVYKVDLMMLYLREKNLNSLTGIELSGIAPDYEQVVPVPNGALYRVQKLALELPLKEPGAYLLVARSGELEASGMVLVSDLALTADEQADSGRVRLFLENQRTHEPIGRAHVKVVGSRDGRFQSGETDLRGIFTGENVQGVATAIARSGGQFAFYRGKTELQPVVYQQEPAFDRKKAAMENLRKDFDVIQQQRMQELRAVQFNEAEGVEINKAYK